MYNSTCGSGQRDKMQIPYLSGTKIMLKWISVSKLLISGLNVFIWSIISRLGFSRPVGQPVGQPGCQPASQPAAGQQQSKSAADQSSKDSRPVHINWKRYQKWYQTNIHLGITKEHIRWTRKCCFLWNCHQYMVRPMATLCQGENWKTVKITWRKNWVRWLVACLPGSPAGLLILVGWLADWPWLTCWLGD